MFTGGLKFIGSVPDLGVVSVSTIYQASPFHPNTVRGTRALTMHVTS